LGTIRDGSYHYKICIKFNIESHRGRGSVGWSFVYVMQFSGITIYQIETLSSDCIAKCFWWAQWVTQYKFLAFAHTRQLQQSTFDEEDSYIATKRIPILSVFQFHEKLARESVVSIKILVS
jgi:hypothetical protein